MRRVAPGCGAAPPDLRVGKLSEWRPPSASDCMLSRNHYTGVMSRKRQALVALGRDAKPRVLPAIVACLDQHTTGPDGAAGVATRKRRLWGVPATAGCLVQRGGSTLSPGPIGPSTVTPGAFALEGDVRRGSHSRRPALARPKKPPLAHGGAKCDGWRKNATGWRMSHAAPHGPHATLHRRVPTHARDTDPGPSFPVSLLPHPPPRLRRRARARIPTLTWHACWRIKVNEALPDQGAAPATATLDTGHYS